MTAGSTRNDLVKSLLPTGALCSGLLALAACGGQSSSQKEPIGG
jgi:hypothetical protein